MKLKQLAVYTKGSSQKRDESHHRRHGHQHFHEHGKEVREIQERAEEKEMQEIKARAEEEMVEMAKRGNCDPITATWTDGTPMSWANTAPGCPGAGAGDNKGDTKGANKVENKVENKGENKGENKVENKQAATSSSASAASTSPATSSSDSSSNGGGSGPYTRSAYYSASGKSSNGLVFLNNRGDTSKSGCWSQ